MKRAQSMRVRVRGTQAWDWTEQCPTCGDTFTRAVEITATPRGLVSRLLRLCWCPLDAARRTG